MHLNTIAFEPNTSYTAEGRLSMGGDASITNFQLAIETDEVSRVRSFSDGHTTDKTMADIWDYRKITNVRTGKVWDLRLHTAALNGSVGL